MTNLTPTSLPAAMKAAEEINLWSHEHLTKGQVLSQEWLAAIITRRLGASGGEDGERMALLRAGCTLWKLEDGTWELSTRSRDFTGPSLDAVVDAARHAQAEGTKT